MNIIDTIRDMQSLSNTQKRSGRRVGVVPTMGFLHEGHLSLIDMAKKHSDFVIVTIFVNPTQFGPNEDFDQYPRNFENDSKLCEQRGVDTIFAPNVKEMYPEKQTTWVVEEKLSQGLCGKSRPGHFKGVTSVVTKLFNATLPDVAVFGQKDAQQAAVLKKMTLDLNFPIEIIVAPLVREADGLAMSSRNKYLTDDERKRALVISRTLKETKEQLESGSISSASPNEIAAKITDQITQAGGKVDYVEIVDNATLDPVTDFSGETLIAVAAYFGKARLLDNVVIKIN